METLNKNSHQAELRDVRGSCSKKASHRAAACRRHHLRRVQYFCQRGGGNLTPINFAILVRPPAFTAYTRFNQSQILQSEEIWQKLKSTPTPEVDILVTTIF